MVGQWLYLYNKKIKEPKETGDSFAANAKIKSLYGFKRFNMPCFADDSGICISSLNNKPGVYSKNFLEKFKKNKDAFNHIINRCVLLKNTKMSMYYIIYLINRMHFIHIL